MRQQHRAEGSMPSPLVEHPFTAATQYGLSGFDAVVVGAGIRKPSQKRTPSHRNQFDYSGSAALRRPSLAARPCCGNVSNRTMKLHSHSTPSLHLLWRAEIDLPSHCLIHILRSHEDRDPRLHHTAGLGDDGSSSHVRVARQIENNNEVITAKGEIERFEFPAHLLSELFDHRSPLRAALLQQALQTLIGVRTLHEILRQLRLLLLALS